MGSAWEEWVRCGWEEWGRASRLPQRARRWRRGHGRLLWSAPRVGRRGAALRVAARRAAAGVASPRATIQRRQRRRRRTTSW